MFARREFFSSCVPDPKLGRDSTRRRFGRVGSLGSSQTEGTSGREPRLKKLLAETMLNACTLKEMLENFRLPSVFRIRERLNARCADVDAASEAMRLER